MNAPPRRDEARGEAGSIGTTDSTSPERTAIEQRWQVCTRKSSGVDFVFQVYDSEETAEAVAKRLIAIGGNATVHRVTR